MKKIEKLKIDELSRQYAPMTEEELAEIWGGWYCFLECMSYIDADRARFTHYYENMYGSIEDNGGVSSNYIDSTLNTAGIKFNNFEGLPLSALDPKKGLIAIINQGTHAVIFEKYESGNQITYYDPQTGGSGVYTFSDEDPPHIYGF